MTTSPDNPPSGPRVVPISGRAETEAGFMGWVVDYARLAGWDVFHPRWSIQSASGWPDLALVRPPRLVFAELKSERGRLTGTQRRWLHQLERCDGCEVYVWKPSDRDRIVNILGPDDTLDATIGRHPSGIRPA